jgi:hypothetical protein
MATVVEIEMINWNEPSVCPDCGGTRFRTVRVFRDNKPQWMRGCQVCPFDEIIGDVE